MTATPRVVVTAPSSGHGKTAISIGLLAAFAARGTTTAGFKIGPDHAGAAYLGLASGRPGRNLDPRLVGPARLGPLFRHGAAGAGITVVEGALGMFDMLSPHEQARSTAGVAAILRAPVLLVVDVAATGQSVAALVRGFRDHDPQVRVGGVILNRVLSGHHEQVLRSALDGLGVPVLGVIPRRVAAGLAGLLPGRAYGAVPVVHGALDAVRAVRRLGEAMGTCCDLEQIAALARRAPDLSCPAWSPAPEAAAATRSAGAPVVAVTGGPRCGYGYPETAELLVAAGARVAFVDPLRDSRLPAGTAALVIGPGLPEDYLAELSGNIGLAREVAALAAAGRPVVAEGTGLAWLCDSYEGRPMCGVLDAAARDTDVPVTGYRDATAPADSALLAAGCAAVGHKDHRFVVEPRSGFGGERTTPAWEWAGRAEGFAHRTLYASGLGLHWAGVPGAAARLVRLAMAATAKGPAMPASRRRSGSPAEPASVPADAAPTVPVAAAAMAGPTVAGPTVGVPAPAVAGLVLAEPVVMTADLGTSRASVAGDHPRPAVAPAVAPADTGEAGGHPDGVLPGHRDGTPPGPSSGIPAGQPGGASAGVGDDA